MAFSKDKRNRIIAKMKSKSNRNGIRESMAQILEEILSSDDLGGGSINPESAFRLVRVADATNNFVGTQNNVVQDEEWYVVSDNPPANTHFDEGDNARQYVKKVIDADNNATYVFEKPKNADVIVFYDDEHGDVVSGAAVALKDIYVYENNAWVKINARFTNYDATTSTAKGKWANVEGDNNTASGESAHAEGTGTSATKRAAHAEGGFSTASQTYAHAEGLTTLASGSASHAEGANTIADGAYTHAEGRETRARGSHSSSHGYRTVALGGETAVFGRNARVGDGQVNGKKVYFGVGYSEDNIDINSRVGTNLNLHLAVDKDGKVLNKDGNEFITADAVATEIDEKLNVYSGEGDADATFDIFQVTGTAPTFTNPSIIIEKSKNPSQIWIRYSDENKFFDYLNYLKGKEIHLIESGETLSTQQIIITGFAEQVDTFNPNTANEYHQRQITGFSSTPDINIIPTENTKTTYYYNKHTPIRLLVDNNSNHIRTIEQELTHADTTNLSDANNFATTGDTNTLTAAKLYADTQDTAHSDDDRGYTDTQLHSLTTTLANADATTLQSAKDYADDNDKFVDSITLDNTDDGKIKLGYNDDSTGLELDWLPNPGNGAGALTLLKVENDASGKKRLLGSASSDVTAEINSLDDNADNNLKIKGTLIQTETIAEDKLTAEVKTKLNASGSGTTDLSGYSTTTQVDAKDATTLQTAKDYTDEEILTLSNSTGTSIANTVAIFDDYSLTTEVDSKDANTLAAAKQYTDDNAGSGSGSGADAAIESLVTDMEWEIDIETWDAGNIPSGTGRIGFGYNTYGTPSVEFIFPTGTTKAQIDDMVIGRNFAFEVSEGVIEFTPTSHSRTVVENTGWHGERYDAVFTLGNGVQGVSNPYNTETPTLYRATASSGSSSGKHVSTATFDDGKVKLGYSDSSTGIEATILPNPGANDGNKAIPIVRRSGGKLVLVNSTPVEMIEELNGIAAGAANTQKLQGHVIRDETISESKLAAAVKTKLNANSPDLSGYTTNTKLSGIKVTEVKKIVFKNRVYDNAIGSFNSWNLNHTLSDTSNVLEVGYTQPTPNTPAGAYKLISIAIADADWEAMEKIEITGTHTTSAAIAILPFVYKSDLTAGTRFRVLTSGSASIKVDLYFEEDKNQAGSTAVGYHRLVIEAMESPSGQTGKQTIGDVHLIHQELVIPA